MRTNFGVKKGLHVCGRRSGGEVLGGESPQGKATKSCIPGGCELQSVSGNVGGPTPPLVFVAEGSCSVALSEIDRNLLERCLQRRPRAWEDFVDRFMGLVIHVVNHTARARSIRLTPTDRDDLCAEVFLATILNDFALLRSFQGKCSLATYLTVVARRIVVRELLARMSAARLGEGMTSHAPEAIPDPHPPIEQRFEDREEVQRLLGGLQGAEAQVVRMYHLEGKSYREISLAVGMPENSIGPILSRARNKMRRAGVDIAAQ